MHLIPSKVFMKFYSKVLAVFFSIAQLCCGYCSPRIEYLDKASWIGLKMEFTDEITEVLRKEIGSSNYKRLSQNDLFDHRFRDLFTQKLDCIQKGDWEHIIETLLACNKDDLILPYYSKDFNFLEVLTKLKNKKKHSCCGLGYVITNLDEYTQYTEERIKDVQYELEEANLLQ